MRKQMTKYRMIKINFIKMIKIKYNFDRINNAMQNILVNHDLTFNFGRKSNNIFSLKSSSH